MKKTVTRRLISFLCIMALSFTMISSTTAENDESSNNSLKVVTGANQWEGVNISIENLNMKTDGKYNFSVDIFTPNIEVGIILQVSGGNWNTIFVTDFDDHRNKAWRTVEGNFNFADPKLLDDAGNLNFTEFQITKTGSRNTEIPVTFYIDNFIVTDLDDNENVIFSEDFESSSHKFKANNGSVEITSDPINIESSGGLFPIDFTNGELNGFTGRGDAKVEVVETELEDGTTGGALYATGRTETWHGAQIDISDVYEPFFEHQITAQVKIESDKGTKYYLKAQIGEGDDARYEEIALSTLSVGRGWVKLTGTCRFFSDEPAYLYVEGDDPEGNYYIMSMDMYSIPGTKIGYNPSLPALKDAYEDYFLLGNIINPHEIGTTHYELLKHHFNTLTFENSMKPDAMWGDSTYPREPSFSIDNSLKRLVEDGFTIIGHTLSWHGQSPNWLNVAEGSRDKEGVVYKTYEESKANLKLFVDTIAGHYYNNPDGIKIYSWDVLNEAIDFWGNDPVSSYDTWQRTSTGAVNFKSPLYGSYENGNPDAPWDYIYDVFVFAREADPDTILYYNDYNMQNAGKATVVMNMVNELNERYATEYPDANGRLLIEGIGMQEHQDINTKVADVEKSIKKFISTGAIISITELDIGVPKKTKADTLTEEEEIRQAISYARMMNLFKQYSENIERVSFWGVDDQTSWRSDLVCIFNGDLSAKESFHAVLNPEAYLIEHDPEYAPSDVSTVVEDNDTVNELEETTADNNSDDEEDEEDENVSASTDDTDTGNPAVIIIVIIALVAVIGIVVAVIIVKRGKKTS